MTDSLLPNQILSPSTRFVDETGNIEKNWWLFLYNISNAVLGGGAGSDVLVSQILADLDSDADLADIVAVQAQLFDSTLLPSDSDDLAQAQGQWSAIFQSGFLQYTGPNRQFKANINFIVGTNIPNPSGTNAPALLIGSGVPQAWIIPDQAYTNADNGVDLGITAGETQPAGTARGGNLLLIGGGSFGGTGGALTLQGGTSLNGPAGATTVAGGNSTNDIAGDVFIIGGQTGTQGANVHLIMTKVNGISGTVRIRVNSTILYEIDEHGALYVGGSAGTAGQTLVSGGIGASTHWQTGFSGTITTAKLTGGGANGSMTFSNGILTAQVAAT